MTQQTIDILVMWGFLSLGIVATIVCDMTWNAIKTWRYLK